jgi:hypothetical protein
MPSKWTQLGHHAVHECFSQESATEGDWRRTGRADVVYLCTTALTEGQLLIDLQAVKACLLQLPGEELITQGYVMV